jgi:hypothetical protein
MLVAVARNAFVGLPDCGEYITVDSGPRAADNADPWQVWLNYMRFRRWGFEDQASPVPCTEQEWDAGVKSGTPLNLLRREQQYTTGDEWKYVYRRKPNGDLEQLSEEEIAKTDPKAIWQYQHWLPNGSIWQVFQASASLCEELASHAFLAESKARSANARPPINEKPRGNRPEQKRQRGEGRRGKLRSTWLNERLVQHKEWSSDTDIAANGGPSYDTIGRYRSGASSSRDMYVRRKLAGAFGCDLEGVPD